MKTYWVYILECKDGSFYTGSTSNLEKRMSEHKLGAIEGYTKSRRPVKLVFSQYFEDVQYAISAERQIKQWTRAKKLALINNDFDLLHKLSECRNESKAKSVGKKHTRVDGSTPLTMTES